MRFCLLCLLLSLFSCSQNAPVKIKGSDTEVNLAVMLAEAFHENNPEVFISISGGGSGLGIASLLNGTADMANSSRTIEPSEIALFHKRDIEIDSFVFALDAVAFVVAQDIALDSINTRDLAQILSGEYKNWKALTNQDIPINIYGRQSNSGTHSFIKDKLNITYDPHAKQMNGNGQILEAIKNDHSGIGYVGAGYVKQKNMEGLKILPVYTENNKAVSPLNAEMISQGAYFFQRPLFQYYKISAYPRLKPFLEFEKSPEGRRIIENSGYYPVTIL